MILAVSTRVYAPGDQFDIYGEIGNSSVKKLPKSKKAIVVRSSTYAEYLDWMRSMPGATESMPIPIRVLKLPHFLFYEIKFPN